MAKKTWHDRILAYMLAHGYREVKMQSTTHRRFKMMMKSEKERSYVLGKGGSVQREFVDMLTGKKLGSASVTDIFKRYVEAWEMKMEREKEGE